jgi:acetyl-CoA carboxylase biotin carboxyl carrier protein
MTLKDVKELIELVHAKGFAEFEIAQADFTLKIVANAPVVYAAPAPMAVPTVVAMPGVAPVAEAAPATAPAAAAAAAAAAPAAEEALVIVKSPIVGTFYRAPGPTADPFAKVGDRVDVGTVLCIVEAMKLMNEIESDTAGEIVKIFVENAQPVEYGQPLFGVRP